MFTQNYIEFQKLMFTGVKSNAFVTHSGASASGQASESAGAIGMYMDTLSRDAPDDNASSVFFNFVPHPGVRLGTGNRPATRSDYAMENMLTSGVSVTKYKKLLLNPKDGVYSYLAQFAVKNTTQSELNIWEIGYYGTVCTKEGNDYIYSDVLMERTVLENPITIPPGESRLISYKITFNQVFNG